ncbi:four helix bundle protein [candidate division KSB1 bacterium]
MPKKIEKFEDFEVWQESVELCLEIYKCLKECKDFSLKDQMQRAAVSIPSNIAEGYERQSNKEFIRFLFIAKGSCGELRTQIYIALELNLIDKNIGEDLIEKTKRISAMLSKLIKTRAEKF